MNNCDQARWSRPSMKVVAESTYVVSKLTNSCTSFSSSGVNNSHKHTCTRAHTYTLLSCSLGIDLPQHNRGIAKVHTIA